MIYSTALLALFATQAAAHGLVTFVLGANGVKMPGLTVIDGTFRQQQNLFGQGDTSHMDDVDMGPLGATDNGPVKPETNVAIFMGNSKPGKIPPPLLPGITGSRETIVHETAGDGAKSGLPTPNSDGILAMNWFQINRDGAGPLSAQLDTSSGGTQLSAFKDITVTQNIEGFQGGSDAALTDLPVRVQIPSGTKCTGTIAGTKNVCVVRVLNPAGPWGGSAAFTTSNSGSSKRSGARKMSRRSRITRSVPEDEVLVN